MKTDSLLASAACLLAASFVAIGTAASSAQDQASGQSQPPMASVDRAAVDKLIAGWPERPRLGAAQMMAKYGPPQEITAERIIWHDQGPFKRITITRKEDPHDFPMPHMDFMEHTINYDVPAGAADVLTAYDGSCTIDRTKGEMSARCDLEGHNILTLNLAHDILMEKVDYKEAREQFGENVVEDLMGNKPEYVTKLQFEPPTEPAAFADEPTIPGSPLRAGGGDAPTATASGEMSDAEIMGFVVAINMNEILAAAEAEKRKISLQPMEYAKMLHMEHGKNLGQTLKLGEEIDVRPVITPAVDALQVKGAGALAAIVPLEGTEFEQAYLDLMITGHTEALEMIDSKLLANVDNADLKAHLTMTREHVAAHLERAKVLREQ